MATSVLTFLVLFILETGAHFQFPNRDQQTDPSLADRVGVLENLLIEQSEKLSDQELLFIQQGNELSAVKAELSDAKSMIRKQNWRILNLETVLSKKSAKLDQQNRLLAYQGKVIQQLKSGHVYSKMNSEESASLNSGKNTDKDDVETSRNSPVQNKTLYLPHGLASRSDDAGILQTVVDHISEQVTTMTADIQTLKNANTQHDQLIQDARTSTFIHWGSSQCTGDADLVYSGVVGGSFVDHAGSATNFLCVTMSPRFSSHSLPVDRAYLYGAEYRTSDSHQFYDPVCAACRSPYSTTLMIPGTNECSPGWQRQYSGYLMAGRFDNAAGTEYICVDTKMEAGTYSNGAENGKMLDLTVTVCGSLPCPPYTNNSIATCAVCSK